MTPARINLATPIEEGIGYGICGTNLAVELSCLLDVNITCYLPEANVQRPIELNWLAPRIRSTAIACDPALPTLYVQDVGDRPPGRPVVMYTCLDTERPSAARGACYEQMDVLVGMSSWNRESFEAVGFRDCHVIPQGVDPTLFFPRPVSRRVFSDRYVFFSGGKFEYRKGQDVVLAAWKAFHARHPDALLVTSWFNAWPSTMRSMALSDLIEMPSIERADDLPAVAAANGIDPDSILWQPPMPNWALAAVYHQCDCGLFPTRGEPATNMPMTELMACGRPVVASFCGGQTDVLRPGENCVALRDLAREPAGYERPPAEDLGEWWTPGVDELVEAMEWCYANRDAAAALGRRAAEDLHATLTWRHTAERFAALMTSVGAVADLAGTA